MQEYSFILNVDTGVIFDVPKITVSLLFSKLTALDMTPLG